jgi:hypothetical protein
MFKKQAWFLLFIGAIFVISGCGAPIVAGVAAGGAGAGSGTYLYVKGEMATDYYFSFDNVWTACEKVVADRHGIEVEPYKEISKGTINAIIDGEKVHISVKYKAKNVTTVAIRVGILGNKLSSQLLHDKIDDNLIRK